jgi:flagellar M-ring protein FliF
MFDRFRAASVGQQTRWLIIGVVIIATVLVAAWFSFLRTTYKPIFTNLRPNDAAAIVADLEHRKVPFQLADGGATILVPADQVDMTRLNVMGGDMPLKGTVGFELFSKSDMGLTDFAQKINYQRALQGELERTIMTLDGVDVARVHLSLGEDRLFRDDRVSPKASITIRMKNQATFSDSAVLGVRRLVAAAVPNLDVADVVILDEKGDVIGAAPVSSAVEPITSPLQEEKRAVEQLYEGRIRDALEHAGQSGKAGIKVILDPTFRASDDGRAPSGFSTWNPSARDFGLQITITPLVAMDGAAQENVRNLAVSAIAPANGRDQISFGEPAKPDVVDELPVITAPIPHNALKAPSLPLVPGLDDGNGSNDLLLEIGTALLLAAIFITGIYLLLRRVGSARRLNAQERADLVVRLRKALDGGAHATS